MTQGVVLGRGRGDGKIPACAGMTGEDLSASVEMTGRGWNVDGDFAKIAKSCG